MSSLVVTHPVNNTCNNSFKSKAKYSNTQQDLTRVITTSPNSRHERLLAGGVSFAEQPLRVDPYFQYFSTSSSWLPFLHVPSNSIKNWTNN
jgi:hypothetical protein